MSWPDLDALRERWPTLGFATYAYTPGGPVTLEILDGERSYRFVAPTLVEAIASAFPEPDADPPAAAAAPAAPQTVQPAVDIFG